MVVDEADGRTVAVAYAKKDAPLIAAAPFLRDLCKQALQALDEVEGWSHLRRELRNALADLAHDERAHSTPS